MTWTEKQIKELAAAGKIKGYTIPQKPEKYSTNPAKNIPAPKPRAITWLDMNIQYWCKERSLALEKEYRFDEVRRWRFDYAIVDIKVAVEYEGIFTKGKSRHTTVTGYTGDADKYNQAAVAGWRVIRLTAKNYKSVLEQLNKCIQ
jgi:very-short-patch-repair endonuclease